LNPHGPFKPCGFSYRLRLSPPGHEAHEGSRQVCGLDYPFTISRKLQGLGAARLVSTPSRLVLTGLGSGLPFKVSPNLSSSASPVSQTSTQVFLKSAAYAIPPRPRAAVLLMIGHVARFYTSVCSSECVHFVKIYLLELTECLALFRKIEVRNTITHYGSASTPTTLAVSWSTIIIPSLPADLGEANPTCTVP